jgi:NTE family protein
MQTPEDRPETLAPSSAEGAPGLVDRRPGDPRVVLVLGGGGMRGMAHIGVLRGLAKLGIHVDAIVGTSIGSLIGALAAGGLTLEEIEQRIEGLRKEDYFRLNVVKFLLKGMRAPSMYRGDTFRQRLEEILPDVGFDDLALPFYCNAVRLESGGSVFWGSPGFRDVSLVDAVYSSCALPGIFEPFNDGTFNYMDGGIVDPVPLRFASTLSPQVTIAVDLTIKATMKTPNYKNRAVSTLFRAFEIAEEVVAEQNLHMHVDYRTALVQPKVGHLSRFDFDDVHAVVELGEQETMVWPARSNRATTSRSGSTATPASVAGCARRFARPTLSGLAARRPRCARSRTTSAPGTRPALATARPPRSVSGISRASALGPVL